jgi:tetratricopeptide (TPR) repeat protein
MEPSAERSRALSAAKAHLDRGFRFEGAGTLERALDAYRDALAAQPTPVEEVEARLRSARVYRNLSNWERCRAESSAAIRLADEIGADDLAAEAMNVEIGALQIQGFLDEAEALGHRALARSRTARVRGITLQNLGRGAAERGDFDASDRYFQESIESFRSANYEIGLAVALGNAAKAALDRGDPHRALQIGNAFAAIGELDSAESLLTEALGHFTSARNVVRQAECLEIMGQMSEARGDAGETARRCYARARELAISSGDHPLAERLSKRLGLSA